MFRGSGGSKSRLAKAAGAIGGEIKNCTSWWRAADLEVKMLKKHFILRELLEVDMSKSCPRLRHEAHFEVKMLQAPQVRSTFGRSVVEKESVRHCGAKHISKPNW